jgi:hypothetical protein
METNKSNQEGMYRVRVKGIVNDSFDEFFGPITIISRENGETLLVGQFPDQPALRGFVNQLWNLNFTLLSLERIEHQTLNNVLQITSERWNK